MLDGLSALNIVNNSVIAQEYIFKEGHILIS
jgi:hypothetical protein